MRIRVRVGGQAFAGTLLETPTALDFASLLPLIDVSLDNYAATERIMYLPRKLSTSGAPPGHDPAPGDICYYAPWGNLALFYRDAPYAPGLVKLGVVDAPAGWLAAAAAWGPLKAMIEAAGN